MTDEKNPYVGKKIRIIHADGERTRVKEGILVSQDEHFITIQRNGIIESIGKRHIIRTEITNGNTEAGTNGRL